MGDVAHVHSISVNADAPSAQEEGSVSPCPALPRRRAHMALLLLPLLCCLLFVLNGLHSALRWVVSFEVISPVASNAQIFWAVDGRSFSEGASIVQSFSAGAVTSMEVVIPERYPAHVRIDPTQSEGGGKVRNVQLRLEFFPLRWYWDSAQPSWKGVNLKDSLGDVPGQEFISIKAANDDPQLVTAVIARRLPWWFRLLQVGSLLLSLVWFRSIWAAMGLVRKSPIGSRVYDTIRIAANWLAEEDLIIVSPTALIVMLSFLACMLACVALNLHGSSLGSWNSLLPGRLDRTTIFGSPRTIRGDEWNINTPSQMAQFNSGAGKLPSINPSVGGGRAPLLRNLPVAGWSSYVRPHNWGFLLFTSFDRAFSFYWIARITILFISCYLTLLLFTEGSAWWATFGSTLFFFSSYTQWWFSTPLPEIVGYGLLSAILVLYILYAKKRWMVVACAMCLPLFISSFCMSIYPPWQVSIGYVCAAVFVAAMLQRFYGVRKKPLRISSSARIFAGVALVGSLGVSAAFLYRFYLETKETVPLAINTVYPGLRRSTGVTLEWEQVFLGFFGWFLTEGNSASSALGMNICEASSYFFLSPFLLVMGLGFGWHLRIALWPITVLFVFFLWLQIFGLPELPAEWLLFSRVPPSRAFLAMGVLNTLITVVILRDNAGRVVGVGQLRFFFTYALLFLFWCACMLGVDRSFPKLMTLPQMLQVSAGMVTLVCLAGHGYSRCAMALLTVLTLGTNGLVNPVARGTGALSRSDLFQFVQGVERIQPEAKWAVFQELWVAEAVKAAGAWVLNGTKFPPDLKLFALLDDSRAARAVYNRFAHIALYPTGPNAEPYFSLVNNETFILHIHPCHPLLARLGITHYVFSAGAPTDATCLEGLTEAPLDTHFAVYRRIRDSIRR